MKAVNALRSIGGLCLAGFAGAGLFPAATAAVGWGDEKWGEMVWGAGQAAPVPALSNEGLLVALAVMFLTGAFFAMRRRHTTH